MFVRDSFMIASGMLVTGWPLVFGCDGAGVVVQVGDKAADKFKVGDEVCGCTRLGTLGHSPAQEFVRIPSSPHFVVMTRRVDRCECSFCLMLL